MSGKIFINYRKSLSLEPAQLLHRYLVERFGKRRVYLDVHGLAPGSDWFSELTRQVHGSAVMLVLIPPGWEDVVDEADPERTPRLFKPDDFVRLEITTALERQVDIVPVLLNREALPPEETLPRPLRRLHDAQFTHFRSASYDQDAANIARAVAALLKKPTGRGAWAAGLAVVAALGAGVAVGPTVYERAGWSAGGDPEAASLQAALSAAEAERDAAVEALAAAGEDGAAERIAALESDLVAARAALSDANARADQAAGRVAELESAVAAAERELETARRSAADATDRVATLESELASARAELQRAEEALSYVRTTAEAATARVEAFEEAAAEAAAQLGRLRAVAPDAVFAPPPSRERDRIRRAQEALIALGYEIGSADGALGERTAAALGAFQAAVGLTETGAVDAATLDALALALRYADADEARPAAAGFEARLLALPQGEALAECESCPEMVAIPAGSFTMGSPENEDGRDSDEGPQREVTIDRFAIGRYEITFDEWDACAADGYCRAVPSGGSNDNDTDRGWGRGDRPVIEVSWNDVTGEGVDEKGFLAWLNWKATGSENGPYRLPSEAEWEYAARAGSTTRFSFGDAISRADANYGSEICCSGLAEGADRWEFTAPVGSFPENRWGLYDVHGNVWEWVEDCWHGSYDGAPRDGSAWMEASDGDCSRAVLRGGSWDFGPWLLRSAYRLRNPRGIRSYVIGFRVARTLRD